MKLGKEIHEIFLFYTPKLMDVYFTHLKNKIQKAIGVTTLLVKGSELPDLHSESHMMDEKLLKISPNVKEDFSPKVVTNTASDSGSLDKITSIDIDQSIDGLDLTKQNNIKKFSKNAKAKQSNKSCILNKKAS